MEHKNCGKIIIEEIPNQATIHLKCLNCGKVWSILSDLSDIDDTLIKRGKLGRSLFFFELKKFRMRARLPSFIINFLFNQRLRHIVQMIDFSLNKKCVGLDIGCDTGHLTQYLAHKLNGVMIGVDVSKYALCRAKIITRLRARYEESTLATVEFICSDVTNLPFKKDSLDLVVSASVLEHVSNLEEAIKEMKRAMRKEGSLIAGYPIETGLFKILLRLFLPSGLIIRDSQKLGKAKFESSPKTHKHSFRTIRSMLQRHFIMVQREKSFFTVLPDQVSWYESVKMKKAK